MSVNFLADEMELIKLQRGKRNTITMKLLQIVQIHLQSSVKSFLKR